MPPFPSVKPASASSLLKGVEILPKEIQMTQQQQWKRAMIVGGVLAVATGALGILGNYILLAVFN